MTSKLNELQKVVNRLSRDGNYTFTPIKEIKLLKSNRVQKWHSVVPFPKTILILCGECRVKSHGEELVFRAGDYLVLPAFSSIELEFRHSPGEKYFLASFFSFDLDSASDILLRIDQSKRELGLPEKEPFETDLFLRKKFYSNRISVEGLDLMLRLFKSFLNPLEIKILSPLIVQEIYFRFLTAPQGAILRQLVSSRLESLPIQKVIAYIGSHLKKKMTIQQLSKIVHMSPSSFYRAFKLEKQIAPLQYIKTMRLERAHEFIEKGFELSEASGSVGYNSTSQFSREFKRHFGYSPSQVLEFKKRGTRVKREI